MIRVSTCGDNCFVYSRVYAPLRYLLCTHGFNLLTHSRWPEVLAGAVGKNIYLCSGCEASSGQRPLPLQDGVDGGGLRMKADELHCW